MANRNVFEALNATPDGGAPKNAFDLHNFEWLTSKAGQLLPVGCREVVPDGTYDLSVDAYTMTFPCNTASQADMKENYYFLFVPYYLLTRTAYSFFPQRKDNHSALDYQYSMMPWFPLGDVVYRCVYKVYEDRIYDNGGMPLSSDDRDVHGYGIYEGALRLLDLLGYGCYLDIVDKAVEMHNDADISESYVLNFLNSVKLNLNHYMPNALRIAAYQKAWYCYFRNSIYDNNISPKSFNFDDVTYPSDTTYNILDYRTVDDFIKQCLQIRYVQNKKDYVNASMPGTQFGAISSVPITISDFGATFTGNSVTPTFTGSETTIPGFMTQDDKGYHTIRKVDGTPITDAEWATFINNGTFYPYNKLDFHLAGSPVVKQTQILSNQSLQQSYLGVPGDSVDPYYDLHAHYVPEKKFTPGGTISSITPSGTVALSSSGASLFDVLALTEAQAIQKWRQKSMLAGQKAKDQWRAHYGVVPDHMRDDYPDFIGSVDNVIQISQVVSQANTVVDDDKSNLGDIAGRGYGASNNKKFRFHAKEFGVVMLLRSVVAENVYSSFGLDRANELIYYNDFWQPEFQNIGLEAVPKSLIQGFYVANNVIPDEGGDEPLPWNSSIIGYAPRNYQLKQYVSKVHGLFNPSRFAIGAPTLFNPTVPYGFGQLESFVQLRRDVIQHLALDLDDDFAVSPETVGITLSTLYVNPAVTDSTFAFDANGYEDTDTFITKHRFNCDSVQPLSTLGLPQF